MTTEKERTHLIHEIAVRGCKIYHDAGIRYPLIDAHMDIDYTDQSNPLDLQKLLDFNAHDFIHDIAGIRRHLDRRTLKLTDCFSPRCSL